MLGDAQDQLPTEGKVAASPQSLDHLLGDRHNIATSGHDVEQVEGDSLKRLVRVIEAVHDGDLVRDGILAVDGCQPTKSIHTETAVRVVLPLEEGLDMRGELVEHSSVWCQRGGSAQAFVHNGESGTRARVGPLRSLGEHLVDVPRVVFVASDEQLEHLEDPDLEPRRRNSVIVVAFRQPVLDDLLQDRHKRGHQVVVRFAAFRADHVVEHHHCRRHDAWVPVTERLPHPAHHASEALLV
mmetsp:Transcript_16608/g.64868  ORF Transcript_16608/g.64868 Transcript_16608/m.64868 type:complete len:240 (+) Transcript_16608:3970-4689(+)